ncbi:hypothetical protein EIY72_27490 [Pseudomonas vancouverensis]|uniref:Uncharacterized protein n=1 Tax=Pseudomonas vancouverensis TaxID=95300 RepID=A0A4R4JRF4_PSEVA|nr:hypothetical protein F7R09_16395 [Pseudomonas vancouverensis]TDB57078.1 hypothetical protein EIY72_27490 [Pseudomonas vancouverensis]
MFAMDVNDDAGCLEAPIVPTFFASMLAPTEGGASVRNSVAVRPSSRASSLPQKRKSRARARARPAHTTRFSPLNRMSVSSTAAFDLPAPSAG